MHEASELMERVRVRDARAFEMLYDAYHRVVYGIALRVLADRTLAEDVTQNVFLKIWNAPEHFRSGNFAAWIVRVTRNAAVDLLRSRNLRAESELPETMPVDGFEDAALLRLDRRRVLDAIASLPDEQRAPIELGFFGGMTHERIAARTGIPLGTIKTRIRTGLRKLRAELAEALSV